MRRRARWRTGSGRRIPTARDSSRAMEEMFTRVGEQLVDREHGPLTFRLAVQPLVATLFAVRSGLRDAREGQPLYFWAAALDSTHRRFLIRQGWRDVGKLFVVAMILDVIYQLIVFRWVYPGELLLVAFVLAIVPYLVVRGMANRIARPFQGRHQQVSLPPPEEGR